MKIKKLMLKESMSDVYGFLITNKRFVAQKYSKILL